MSDAPADKKRTLEQLLETGVAQVTVDARKPGVDVPDQYRSDLQLRLNLSYQFANPMSVKDWGVDAVLTFGGDVYECKLPWECLYMMVSLGGGPPYLFRKDVPPELLAAAAVQLARSEGKIDSDEDMEELREAAADHLIKSVGAVEPEARPQLQLLEGEISNSDRPPEGPPPKRGHLRVVK